MPVRREIARGQMLKRLNRELRAAPGLYPGVHVGSTSFSSSCHHKSTAALLTNKNHAQYRAAFVHIHSPHVLFLSRQGILCNFHFKAREERQIALLYNHRALKLYPILNTNNREILEGAFVVSRYFAPLHRAINITRSKHMIYDMFCLGHFCASLQLSLYARHHLSQTSNKTSHLKLLS